MVVKLLGEILFELYILHFKCIHGKQSIVKGLSLTFIQMYSLLR